MTDDDLVPRVAQRIYEREGYVATLGPWAEYTASEEGVEFEGARSRVSFTHRARLAIADVRACSPTIADEVKADPALAHVTSVGSDRDLLRLALMALARRQRAPVWVAARDALLHGSTVACAICRAVGLDPEADGLGEGGRWRRG